VKCCLSGTPDWLRSRLWRCSSARDGAHAYELSTFWQRIFNAATFLLCSQLLGPCSSDVVDDSPEFSIPEEVSTSNPVHTHMDNDVCMKIIRCRNQDRLGIFLVGVLD
jgi:hypothetical protein